MPKQTLAEKSVYWMKVISLGLILGLGIQFAEAWTSPTLPPPNSTISGPITTSGIGQIKQGNLALNADGLAANALIIQNGNIWANGSAGSAYGAITLQGSKNAYSGINFKDVSGSNAGTLMMHPSYSGFLNAADNNWRWYVDENGTSYQPGGMLVWGSVGIGTLSPVVKLDVNGAVRVGQTSASCSGAMSGALRYNTSLNCIEFCNGAAWACTGGSTYPNGGPFWLYLGPVAPDFSNGFRCPDGTQTSLQIDNTSRPTAVCDASNIGLHCTRAFNGRPPGARDFICVQASW